MLTFSVFSGEVFKLMLDLLEKVVEVVLLGQLDVLEGRIRDDLTQ